MGTFLSLVGLAGACFFLILKYRVLIKHWFHSPPGIPVQIEEVRVRASSWEACRAPRPPLAPHRTAGGRAGDTEVRVKSSAGFSLSRVHSSLIHNSQGGETAQCLSEGERINKWDALCTRGGTLFSLEKEIPTPAGRVDEP